MAVGYGTMMRTAAGWEVRFERRLKHSQQQVWDAITGPGQMSQWFDRTEFPKKLKVGESINFFHDAFDAKSSGRITAVDPPRLIEWTWISTFGPDQKMSWAVEPDGDGSRLILVQWMGDLSLIGRTLAGWHVSLDRLQSMLDGVSGDHHATTWPSLFEYYRGVLQGRGFGVEQQGAPTVTTSVN